jgi:hypothetical protein
MAMSSSSRPTRTRSRNAGRVRYRLTADQVLRMIEAGIIPDDEDVELWDGVLFLMTKQEPHNAIVGQIADLLRPLIPTGYHIREEKSHGKKVSGKKMSAGEKVSGTDVHIPDGKKVSGTDVHIPRRISVPDTFFPADTFSPA